MTLKFKNIWSLLVVASAPLAMSAEMTSDYQEHFESLNVANPVFAPRYWGHHQDPYGGMTYTNPSEGGQVGAYLEAGEQYKSFFGGLKPDYLVTPEVSGTVKFYAKLTDAAEGYVKLYKVTGQTDTNTYEFESEACLVADNTTITADGWTELTVNDVPEGTRLGFLINKAAVDEFSATSANLVARKAMQLSSVVLQGELDNFAGEDNTIVLNTVVTLSNSGDVDFTPGDEGYSLDFYLGGYSSFEEPAWASVDINEPLPAGSSVSIPMTVTIDVSAADLSTVYYFWIKEGVTGSSQRMTNSSGVTVSSAIYPYKPIVSFNRSDLDVEYKSAIQMYLLKNGVTSTSASVNIKNIAGKAPLTVNSVTLPEGFTSDIAVPAVISAKDGVVVNLTFSSDVPGDHSGIMTLATEELGEVSWPVKAYVVDSEKWLCTFEESTSMPEGFISESGWDVAQAEEGVAPEGDRSCLRNSSYSETSVMTPLMEFAEGDKLMFYAAAHSGSSATLAVKYSDNRSGWTDLIYLDTPSAYNTDVKLPNDFLADGFGAPGLYNQYVVEVPAGKHYISFTGKNVKIDNITGAKLVAVDKDIYVTSVNIPSEGIVNNRMTVTVSARNVGVDLAASDYTATLYVGGQAVATAETYALAKGDSETFTFMFTPHVSGEQEAYVEFVSGEYSMKTTEAVIRISNESAEKVVKTGNDDNAGSYYPLAPSSYNALSTETVYKSEMMPELAAGDEIVSIAYYGYLNWYYGDPSTSANIAVYAENTEDEVPGTEIHSTENMTCLYEGPVTFRTDCPKAAPYEQLTKINLTTPIVYDGKNLRLVIVVAQTESSFNGSVYVTVDKSETGTTIYNTGYSTRTAYDTPVARFGVALEPAVMSGTVVDKSNGMPVSGAEIKIVSNDGSDVVYSAVTDAAGQYSMGVVQSTKLYALSATAEGFRPLADDAEYGFADGDVVRDIELEPESSSIESVSADGLTVKVGTGYVEFEASEVSDVTLVDISGRVVFVAKAFIGTKRVDGLASGVYLLGSRKLLVK